MIELLTPQEMATADRLTIAAGTSGPALMERAGAAVAEAVTRHAAAPARVLILAGPGNNGGDGFVAARLLTGLGYSVTPALLGDRAALKGDAAWAAGAWDGPVAALDAESVARLVDAADLIVDALYGAGLARDLDGVARAVVEAVMAAAEARRLPVVAVDLPSGIDGATGQVRGAAMRATETVTFFRAKPGHLLLPGRAHVGRLVIADIGISDGVLATIAPQTAVAAPALWGDRLRPPALNRHKYDRGHCVVVSGPAIRSGAARLAAAAALRVGAGLVTVAAPASALPVLAARLTAVMLAEAGDAPAFTTLLEDRRLNAVVVGPAAGVGPQTVAMVEAALAGERGVVVDADGLTSFRDAPERLLKAIAGNGGGTVLTPHDGEFARLFPDLAPKAFAPGDPAGAKPARARTAAARSGAVVLLKGADTVIAAPDGRAAILANAPPDLATAGSGDVLAGLAGGLLARNLPAFEAAVAAAWIHGAAGRLAGVGLIAEDLPDLIRPVLAGLAAAAGDDPDRRPYGPWPTGDVSR
jgi:hydroxyethylthiazole kinase-like uncharacterized protein yjeF